MIIGAWSLIERNIVLGEIQFTQGVAAPRGVDIEDDHGSLVREYLRPFGIHRHYSACLSAACYFDDFGDLTLTSAAGAHIAFSSLGIRRPRSDGPVIDTMHHAAIRCSRFMRFWD